MGLQTFFDNFALLADAPKSIPKLRELILQLAVRGKLVEQDQNDEPASLLIQKGLRAKHKQLTAFPDIGIPHEIPTAWQWVRFENIVDFEMGKTPDTKASAYWADAQDGFAWVSIADMPQSGYIARTKKRVSQKAVDEVFKRAPTRKGTLLMSFKLSIGKVAFLDMDAFHNEAIISIHPFVSEITPYLRYCLRGINLLTDSNKAIKGNTLNSSSLRSLSVPLPPLEEQKRIATKVDELMLLCDELEARQQAKRESRVRLNNATLAPLNNAASLTPEELEQAAVRIADYFAVLYDSAETVGKLRSTILQLAVHGKLVPQEPDDEPVSQTLKNVWLEDRRKNEGRSLHPVGKSQPSKSRKLVWREKGMLVPNIDGLPTLPISWEWVCWEMILALEEGSFRRGPFGSALTKGSFVASGYKVYEQYCPINDDCSFGRYYITPQRFKELRSFAVKAGDFLISCSGVTLGRITQVPDQYEEGVINQALLRVRINNRLIKDEFFKLLFRSPHFQEQIFSNSTGTAIPNVKGVKELKAIPLPLPPLREQPRIVAKVGQLMALCDELETKLRQSEGDSEKLMDAAVQHVLSAVTETSKTTVTRTLA